MLDIDKIIERGFVTQDEVSSIDMSKSVKVNITDNESTLNGEGCFGFIMREKDHTAWKDDHAEGNITVFLLNDCMKTGHKTWGLVLKPRLNGENRPTITTEKVTESFEKIKESYTNELGEE